MTEEKEMNEIEEFIETELDKDVTQEESIDKSVEQHIGEMGFLWDRVQSKIKDDAICFGCKSELVFEDDVKVHLVEATKVDKGVIAFVSICEDCFQKTQVEQEAKEKEIVEQKGEE